MNCNNLTNYLTVEDFECVANVAKHCDLSKLCIATEEAKNFDIVPLFCFDFVNDILEHWNEPELIPNPDYINEEETPGVPATIPNPVYERYQMFICGGTYQHGGKSYLLHGFKKVWVYYSYARYLLINQYTDTANGTVGKTNEWSVPTPLKEINDISNKYRNMGRAAFESVQQYLCLNKENFTKFDGCGCLPCGCIDTCGCGKTKKMTGMTFSTIRG